MHTPAAAEGHTYARMHRLIDDLSSIVGPEQQAALDRAREHLDSPLTLALAGRVSSGKSTLLNALVGSRIAMTDATECTRVTTLYVFGPPERVEVIGLDGNRTTRRWSARHELDRAAEQVDFTIAHTTQSRLRDQYRIIDTPGLAGFNDAAQRSTQRALVESSALPKADVTLFLFSGGQLRADEIEFLRSMGARRHNTVLVLSRADEYGEGPLGDDDPFLLANSAANRLAREHDSMACAVVPVAALLAEAGEAGITETEAALLGSLLDVDEDELRDGIDNIGVAQHPSIVQAVPRLEPLIGVYGLIHGPSHAAKGALALSAWLRQQSGLEEVYRILEIRSAVCARTVRPRRVVEQLRGIGQRARNRDDVLAAIEEAELDPTMHSLREVSALELMVGWKATHPLVSELDHAVCSRTAEELLLGQVGHREPFMLESVAAERISSCRTRRLTAFSAAEQEALTVLERTYQLAGMGLR